MSLKYPKLVWKCSQIVSSLFEIGLDLFRQLILKCYDEMCEKKWSFFAFFPKFSSYFIFGTHESSAWRIKHIPNNNKYICGQFQTGSVQVRLIPFSLQNPPIWPFSRKIGKIVKWRLRHQGWRYPTSESGNKSCSACLTTWYSPFYSTMTSKISEIAGGGTLN